MQSQSFLLLSEGAAVLYVSANLGNFELRHIITGLHSLAQYLPMLARVTRLRCVRCAGVGAAALRLPPNTGGSLRRAGLPRLLSESTGGHPGPLATLTSTQKAAGAVVFGLGASYLLVRASRSPTDSNMSKPDTPGASESTDELPEESTEELGPEDVAIELTEAPSEANGTFEAEKDTDIATNEPDEAPSVEEEFKLEEELEEKEEKERSNREEWKYVPTEGDYIALFLHKDSIAQLKKRFPAAFQENQAFDHMTVLYEPSKDDVLAYDDLLTEPFALRVVGIAQDEHVQTLLVQPENPHIESRNKFSHVTLSFEGGDLYDANYSNALLERLDQERGPKDKFLLLKNDKNLQKKWEVKLESTEKYEESQATFENLEDEEIILVGVCCLKSSFDEEIRTCTYKRENECAFCKFMKGGPCREEFISWERCVNEYKDDEDKNAFVDNCASQTLILKNCVDSHPEYYELISDEDEDDDDEEEEE